MSYGKAVKNKNSSFAIIFSSSLGSALEFYEFTVFGFLSAIIAKTYFPSDNPLASLIATFGTFAAGFLARPLGGIIFGYVGDRLGRRLALRLSIMLMGFSTTMIGLIPSYEIIGLMAPIIYGSFKVLLRAENSVVGLSLLWNIAIRKIKICLAVLSHLPVLLGCCWELSSPGLLRWKSCLHGHGDFPFSQEHSYR